MNNYSCIPYLASYLDFLFVLCVRTWLFACCFEGGQTTGKQKIFLYNAALMRLIILLAFTAKQYFANDAVFSNFRCFYVYVSSEKPS